MIKKPSAEQAPSTAAATARLALGGAVEERSDVDDRNGIHLPNSIVPRPRRRRPPFANLQAELRIPRASTASRARRPCKRNPGRGGAARHEHIDPAPPRIRRSQASPETRWRCTCPRCGSPCPLFRRYSSGRPARKTTRPCRPARVLKPGGTLTYSTDRATRRRRSSRCATLSGPGTDCCCR